MAKYRCKICGHIYDDSKEKIKFDELPENWVCPICKVPKSMFEKIDEQPEKKKFENAIEISKDNPSIMRIDEKCIDCGLCKNICKKREGIEDLKNGLLCVNCGQCVQICPTGALVIKNNVDKIKDAIKENKILVAYTSPSVRVSLGDEFMMEKGEFVQGKLVTALRKIGFIYVFDVTFAADLTIVEEANELLERIKNNKNLPMFTSCCPSWVKYAEIFYPELLPNISTCKSPIGMQGEMVKKYFSEIKNIDEDNIFTVAITPCTAKKFEITREEINKTDLVITTKELAELLKEENIDFNNLEDGNYDSLFSDGTGAGMIFGNTGGVMEAALREICNILDDKDLNNQIIFNDVRGLDNVKEASIKINDITINVAVIHQMSSAKQILEDVKNGKSKYHYIEIMNCLGGCIGGGGQPKSLGEEEDEIKNKRMESLYKKDKLSKYRISSKNPNIKLIYEKFLDSPLSNKAIDLLHTSYKKRL